MTRLILLLAVMLALNGCERVYTCKPEQTQKAADWTLSCTQAAHADIMLCQNAGVALWGSVSR